MTERLLVVSADGHVGGRPQDYRPYIDAAYRDAIDDLVAEDAEWNRVTRHEDVAADGGFCGWNMAARLQALDAEGIVAEVVHPGVQGAALPFFSGANRPRSVDLRWAGVRAYHRWLDEHLAETEGRLLGVAIIGPCFELGTTLAELRWAAERGFVAVQLPQYVYDDDLPPLHDPYYEPIWATCEDLGLRLSLHAGWGTRQGRFWEFAAKFLTITGQSDEAFRARMSDDGSSRLMTAMGSADDSPLKLDVAPRRAMWQLMVSGVFDRHPELVLVITELRADWLPATLAALDERCRQASPPMPLLPSEYFARNCFITPSSIHECEVAMRHEIGVDRVMFGTDCPHPEATWPDTHAWLGHAFRDVPGDELRAILGGNAIRCYGLDPAPLQERAGRIGPTVEDIFGAGDVDAELLEDFHRRAGLRRPAEQVDGEVVRQLLDEDLLAVGAR